MARGFIPYRVHVGYGLFTLYGDPLTTFLEILQCKRILENYKFKQLDMLSIKLNQSVNFGGNVDL